MRVTKLIKEYVEEQVRKVFPVSQEEIDIKNKLKEIENAVAEENKKLEELTEKKIEELEKRFGADIKRKKDSWCSKILSVENSPIYFRSSCTEIYYKVEKVRLERETKIKQAIKNILIELEMGATKKQLDQMIEDLGKEV